MTAPLALERLLWKNQYAFARRHRRYAWISLLILGQRLIAPRRGRLLVRGYVFLQAFDDHMDGDRKSAIPPAHLAAHLIRAWRQGEFPPAADPTLNELLHLAAALHQTLGRTARPDANRAHVAALLATMGDDHLRAQNASLWSAERIRAQHRRTFASSLDLLLAALPSTLQSADIPELIDALGWCSTMRDLRQDLAAGLINIPIDIWQQLPDPQHRHPEPFLQHPALITWMQQERRLALAHLQQLDERLPALNADRRGQRIVRLFARSVEQFADKRLYRHYPWLAHNKNS